MGGSPDGIDGNLNVNVLDLVQVITQYGDCDDDDCPADVNHDDIVDVLDIVQVIVNWGPCFGG